MGLVNDVWSAIFGPRIPRAQVAKAAEVVGQVFGAPLAATEARGLLAGVLPYGQPPKRGTMEMMLLYAASPWLRGVVSRIADRIAATEWEVLRVVDDNRKAMRAKQLQHVWGSDARRKMLRRYRKSGNMKVEPVLDHPMLDFLRAGGPKLDGRGSQKTTSVHVLLKGDAYWLLERHESGPLSGLPKAYWPVPPFWIAQTPTVTIPSYRVQFGGWAGRIPETEIVQFTDPDPYNPFQRGVGLAESLSDELDSDEYASKWMKARFFNSGVPGTLVSLKGGGKDEADRMKEAWRQEFGGFMRAFRAYFTPREIDVKTLEPNFEEMKLLELRSSMRDSILEVFGYPKELLGILTNANRSTIDTAEFRLEKYVVEPWREFTRHTLQHRLMREWDDRGILDYVSDVPADREFALKVQKSRPYAFTNNQALQLAGEEPTDEAWGEERPPTPTTAPADTEVISTGGGLGGKRLHRGAARAGEPAWVADLPARRKAEGDEQDDQQDQQAFTHDDIDDVVDAIEQDEFADIDELLESSVQDIGGQAMRALGLEASAFSHRDPAVKAYLKGYSSESISAIDDTTKADIRAALAKVADEGGSVRDAGREIRKVFDGASQKRSEKIAQTEMLRASGVATQTAFKQSGVATKKYWQHGGAEKDPRDGHVQLAEQEPIDLDEPFVNPETGVSMMYPGESGDPGEDCYCHCSHWAKVKDLDEEKAARKAPTGVEQHAWRARGIRQVRAAAKAAFGRQLKSALRALR